MSHLNLHKTFCIPHGGGGPGVGPVGVRAHLAPYLPNHPLQPAAGPETGVGPVSAAPWGSAGHPADLVGLHAADGGGGPAPAPPQVAILERQLRRGPARRRTTRCSTPGRGGLVAHECIVDLRPITKETGVTVDDVAKRLIDYGFHAPTMSFPVAGTLMIEPTESEDLAELDRFCAAMIAIREEIERVASGELDRDGQPAAQRAAHGGGAGGGVGRTRYGRTEAVFPAGVTPATKYWPPVRRIDGAYGDRNLVCSCPPVSELRRRLSGSAPRAVRLRWTSGVRRRWAGEG